MHFTVGQFRAKLVGQFAAKTLGQFGAKSVDHFQRFFQIDEVISAINTVNKGEIYCCKEAAAKLVTVILKKDSGHSKSLNAHEFTDRETEIVNLICQEYSNKQIANKLSVSKRTVDWYRNKILGKLNVKNTAGIVAYAIKHNIC